ncbi:unnamed protein product [Acanthoscelides obtectus]|uniref:Uncharacterized protein n=1 Tax=Acanthoscelides obtectus TaxID=200917 RepID=A0A9P0P857_ACAOB|nr:unnamed protein product [Acanthoscelides obtectus]CAK1648498.1 hypothetical protein AOBTE_LOCUS15728 [Acanthoscelides obtectus]
MTATFLLGSSHHNHRYITLCTIQSKRKPEREAHERP